jgi:hypothetical protein
MSMGVYIKGMEMPTDRPQLLWVYPNGKALTVQSDVDPWKDLQATPVPPHGRLIDADKLHKDTYHRAFETGDDTMWQSGCWVRYRAIEQVQVSQPTIIEAEE